LPDEDKAFTDFVIKIPVNVEIMARTALKPVSSKGVYPFKRLNG
jgi:hypothetical protein